MPLDNGTTQGDPSSMLYYSFHNAPLIKIASTDNKLFPGFVDDSMILAIGNAIGQCHGKLKDMMERPGGRFEWSYSHNLPFELSKTVLMNFPRSYRDLIRGGLILDNPNEDGTVSSTVTLPVTSYEYFGVIFDPKLCWTLQHAKALATATFWSAKLWRVTKSASGLSMAGTKQLYNTVWYQGSRTGLRSGTCTYIRRGGPVRLKVRYPLLTSHVLFRERLPSPSLAD